jgi:predicted AAA+ superfamily ATPase
LAARLIGVSALGLLAGDGERVASSTGTWLGALFESLVTLSVRVYADCARAQVGHLRTREQQEVDLIVEGSDRRVVAIEIKLAPTVRDDDVRHLHWLHAQIGDRLADKVLVNTGEIAYRRPDGVAVVPLALLGP